MPTAVVAGAGIGGLAAAVALTRVGWDVTVLERATDLAPVGAAISLWPNAVAALDHLGIALPTAVDQPAGGVRRPDGRWLKRAALQGLSLLLVHRADLHRALLDALPAGVVRTGVEVDGADPDGRVQTSAGELRADVVVGADGVRSLVRGSVGGRPATYAGFTAWRGVTDEPLALRAVSETWGHGREFGTTRLADGRCYWFATANVRAERTFHDERAELLQRYGRWHDPIPAVVGATSTILRHDVVEHPRPYPPFHTGKIVLVGDAAHAMTPNLGQGGCQALEDAVTLGVCLREGRPLSWYDAQRRPRTQRIAVRSARLGRLIQAEDPRVVGLRDLGVRLTPAAVGVRAANRISRWAPPR